MKAKKHPELKTRFAPDGGVECVLPCPSCGEAVPIPVSVAAVVMGKTVTPARVAALRENAKRPRPAGRGRRKPKTIWAQIMDLPAEERRQIGAAINALPRPGRPKKKQSE